MMQELFSTSYVGKPNYFMEELPKKKKAVAPGIYWKPLIDNPQTWADGRFTYRPIVRGRMTERVLKATTLRAAVKELGGVKEEKSEPRLEDLAKTYLDASAPDKRGKPRPKEFVDGERRRLDVALQFWGKLRPSEVRIKMCLEYLQWRRGRLKKSFGNGERTADMELNTVSNVLNYGVLIEECDANRLAHGRPRFRVKKEVRHSRECCPRSGDELHQLANFLMEGYYGRSQACAWQMLFEALSGCRTREALALRWDAEPGKPGYIRDGKWLYIARAKQREGEAADCIEISLELDTLLRAMRNWRSRQEKKSQWFFPSFRTDTHLIKTALSHALRNAARALWGKGRPITSHGMRAFYVTWQRCKGVSDTHIAEHLGHRSGGAALIWNVYGRKLPGWASPDFTPIPKTVPAAWTAWL